MQVFTYSKVSRVVTLALSGLGFLVLAGLLAFNVVPAAISSSDAGGKWFVAALITFVIIILIYYFITTVKWRFIIGEDSVRLVNAVSERELLFSEIKGYRTDGKYIYIEAIPKDRKPLQITTLLRGSEQILDWLRSRYKDLDLSEKEETYQSMLEDMRYGKTAEERLRRYTNARDTSRFLNFIGVMLAGLIFVKGIEKYTIVLAIAAPVVFGLILRSYQGLIRIGMNRNSPFHTIIWGLIALIFGLLIKGTLYMILDYGAVWQPAILAATVLFLVFVVRNSEFNISTAAGIFGIIVFAGISFIYGFSSVIAVNCIYDTSVSQEYKVTVADKYISQGKSTTYNLRLSRWGNQQKTHRISVSYETYNSKDIGDGMVVHQHSGMLKIPWCIVTEH